MEDAPTCTEAQPETEREIYNVFYSKVAALQEQVLLPQTVYYYDLRTIARELRNNAQTKFEEIGHTSKSSATHVELQLLQARYGTCLAILENLLIHIEEYTKEPLST